MKRVFTGWMLCAGFVGGVPHTSAQTFEGTYTTELQYGGSKNFNWVNLLRLDASLSIKNGTFDLSTIHIYKTRPERIASDWQVFSNIEEDNRAVSLFVMGYTQHFRRMSLFGGLRNVNEDYFNSPVTSLFTNSSCGIFPTLSANYPLANYPLSAVCLDYKLSLKSWSFETSIYNGVAHSGFGKKNHMLSFNPRRDGVFSLSSLNYQSDYGNYFGGVALHNRMCVDYENGEQISEQEKEKTAFVRKMNWTWWAYAEQAIYRNLRKRIDLLIQYSENPSVSDGCRRYVGLGMVFSNFPQNKSKLGVCFNYAQFGIGDEKALEVTYNVKLTNKCSIQPAVHWIRNRTGVYTVGMMRMVIHT